jgi:hypothetical protein
MLNPVFAHAKIAPSTLIRGLQMVAKTKDSVVAEAKRLEREGWQRKDIGRHLGISPPTLIKYLGVKDVPEGRRFRTCECGSHAFANLTHGYVTLVNPEDVALLGDSVWFTLFSPTSTKIYAGAHVVGKTNMETGSTTRGAISGPPPDGKIPQTPRSRGMVARVLRASRSRTRADERNGEPTSAVTARGIMQATS